MNKYIYKSEHDITIRVMTSDEYVVSDVEKLHHAAILCTMPPAVRHAHTLGQDLQERVNNFTGLSLGRCPFTGDNDVKANGDVTKHGVSNVIDDVDDVDNEFLWAAGEAVNGRNAQPRALLQRHISLTNDVTNTTKHIATSNDVMTCPPITTDVFCALFPYHVVFDDKLVIKQVGYKLGEICPHVRPGDVMSDVFSVTYPRVPFTFKAILEFFNSCFVLYSKDTQGSIGLKGNG